ncbi:MAG: hypothetical protein QNJ98_15095 [Planctomycetota bacterium]|nr:hypothetical protein [Planctomycetota bacterium]
MRRRSASFIKSIAALLLGLALTACQMPTLQDESPAGDAVRLRIARIQQAIDDQFREAYGMPDGHARTQKVGALSHAQGRLSAAETMAVGASVTGDAGATARADFELRRLEMELGIVPQAGAVPR